MRSLISNKFEIKKHKEDTLTKTSQTATWVKLELLPRNAFIANTMLQTKDKDIVVQCFESICENKKHNQRIPLVNK